MLYTAYSAIFAPFNTDPGNSIVDYMVYNL